MNWTKQTYLSASALAEQKENKINEIVYSFDFEQMSGARTARFFASKGEVAVEVEILGSDATLIHVLINGIFAGEFYTQKCAFNVQLKEGVNIIELLTNSKDNGMLVRIKGLKLERIYNPLKVIGSTEFGEGCLLYTYENGEVVQRVIGASGGVSVNKMIGYSCFDSKNFYTAEGVADRLVSIGVKDNKELIYIDNNDILTLDNAEQAVIVEKADGGAYVFYIQTNALHLVVIDSAASTEYYMNILEDVEEIIAATNGSLLLFKHKAKWWCGEIGYGVGGIVIGDDNLSIKIYNLNTVNRPNASYDKGAIYYICRGGNMYKHQDQDKNVLAYCEYYVPFKGGGVMIWSKKLYVYLNDN